MNSFKKIDKNTGYGYKIKAYKRNNLFYMDDIKLYARNNELGALLAVIYAWNVGLIIVQRRYSSEESLFVLLYNSCCRYRD